MNIASFILPKVEVAYLRDHMTIRQGLEKMRRSGYTAIPVIDREDRYVGVISEGDFLWRVLEYNSNLEDITMKKMEELSIRDLIQMDKVKPVFIDTNMEQLLGQAQNQNFVPVVDDRDMFVGIVTRRSVMAYLMNRKGSVRKGDEMSS